MKASKSIRRRPTIGQNPLDAVRGGTSQTAVCRPVRTKRSGLAALLGGLLLGLAVFCLILL